MPQSPWQSKFQKSVVGKINCSFRQACCVALNRQLTGDLKRQTSQAACEKAIRHRPPPHRHGHRAHCVRISAHQSPPYQSRHDAGTADWPHSLNASRFKHWSHLWGPAFQMGEEAIPRMEAQISELAGAHDRGQGGRGPQQSVDRNAP